MSAHGKHGPHAMCGECWMKRHLKTEPNDEAPGGYQTTFRFPVCVKDPEKEQCCFCDNTTKLGIYVRGEHDAECQDR